MRILIRSFLLMPEQEVAARFRTSLQSAFADIDDLQRNQRISQTKCRSEHTTMNDRLLNAFLAGSIDELVRPNGPPRGHLKFVDPLTRDAEPTIRPRRFNAKVATTDATDVRAALAVFEFWRKIAEIWRGSKMLEKRCFLETVSLNRVLCDGTLVLKKRKPFGEFAERPLLRTQEVLDFVCGSLAIGLARRASISWKLSRTLI